MSFIDAVILGIIEGVTEFLPISSTAHLILSSHLLKLPQTEFLKSFEIIIQLGAILAVVVLYAKSMLVRPEILKKVAAAFIPTAVLGLFFYKIIKKFFMGNTDIILWALFLGGIFLILFDLKHKENESATGDITSMSFKTAILIGCFQALAFIPGVSRAAATIIGGLILGMKRKTIVEFSFLLAIPTMAAATGLDILKNAHSFSMDQCSLLAAGFVTAFFVAILSIKFLLHFIQKHNFIAFGIYRVLIVIVFILLVR